MMFLHQMSIMLTIMIKLIPNHICLVSSQKLFPQAYMKIYLVKKLEWVILWIRNIKEYKAADLGVGFNRHYLTSFYHDLGLISYVMIGSFPNWINEWILV